MLVTELNKDLLKDLERETEVRWIDNDLSTEIAWSRVNPVTFLYFNQLDNDCLSLSDSLGGNGLACDNDEFLKRIKDILPKRKIVSVYDLEVGDSYWTIDMEGYTYERIYEDCKWERALREKGIMYLTEEEAIKIHHQRLATEKIKKRIRELNDGWKPNWEDDMEIKHNLYYSYYGNGLLKMRTYSQKLVEDCYYLKTYELAKQLAIELEEEYKLMLGVE